MINLSFENFEEMQGFAKKLLREEGCEGYNPSVPETVIEPALTTAAPVQMAPAVQQPTTAPVVNPVQQAPVVQLTTVAPAQVQVTTTEYTQEDIARAAMTLMDAGKQQQLQELLTSYGVVSLPELPKEQYGNFATALRGLGAQI